VRSEKALGEIGNLELLDLPSEIRDRDELGNVDGRPGRRGGIVLVLVLERFDRFGDVDQ
jgi:hypothetical protein